MAVSGQAQEDFSTARRKAFWNEILSLLRRRPNKLLSWDEVRHKLQVRGRIYRGMQTVPVSKIIGSVGRYQDFDRVFLPTQDETAARWCSIDRAHYNDVSLGAVPQKLYQ
jgi:hypothetical protein